MKYIFLLFSIIVSLSIPALARKPNPVDKKTEAELIQIERDIGQANIRRDKKYFEMIEGDEFIFVDSGGGLTTKAEDVASLDQPAGEFKLVSYHVDEVVVRVYGKTAIVTGRSTTVSRSRDREVSSKSRFTDVFVKRNGKWVIVTGHSSRIREPQPQK